MATEVKRDGNRKAASMTLVGRMNRRSVLEHFLTNGRASLRELSDSLQMSNPTVRKAVGSLSETGLLVELPEKQQSITGRPGAVYRLAVHESRLAGVALSATHIEVAETGLDGLLSDAKRRSFDTPKQYDDLVQAIARTIADLIPANARLLGVGLSVPGEVDVVRQKVIYSPNLHVTDGKHLARDVQVALNRPETHVTMYKDTSCGCLAERRWGVAAGRNNFVVLGVLEGFGAGVWANGRLLTGHNNLAPEVGHICVRPDGEACSCGNRGCLETVATDAAFVRLVNRRNDAHWTLDEILQRANAGQLDIAAELEVTLGYLGVGVSTLIDLFAPSLICLDSRLLDASPDAMDRLREQINDHVFPTRREVSELTRVTIDNARGAVAAALHDFLSTVGPSPLRERRGDVWTPDKRSA